MRGGKIVEPSKATKFISRWIDPRCLVGPVIFVAALHGTKSLVEAASWTLVVLSTAILPLLGFIAFQTRRGIFADDQVPTRHRRNQAYLVGNACLLVCLLILTLLQAPKSLIALLLAMLASGSIASGLNLHWKVSIHTGALAGAAVSLLVFMGPLALPALALIPLVAWTRLVLRRHTLGQVIAGGIVGASATALTYWLMSPL